MGVLDEPKGYTVSMSDALIDTLSSLVGVRGGTPMSPLLPFMPLMLSSLAARASCLSWLAALALLEPTEFSLRGKRAFPTWRATS